MDRCNDCVNCKTPADVPVEIRTPVGLKITARTGEPELFCIGEPATVMTDCEDGCRLLIIQKLKVRFAVCYEAEVIQGKSETSCAEDC